MKAEGRAILYISHKLDEVKRLCDTATILRGGKKVATCDPRQRNRGLARAHDGRRRDRRGEEPGRRAHGKPRLVVRDLTMVPEDPHGIRLDGVSVEVRGGEILGIAGVAGNGQDELFAALSGERLATSDGTIVIDGEAAGRLSIPGAAGSVRPSCRRSGLVTRPRRA